MLFRSADFKGAAPALVLEDYFLGDTVASGIFEDRFGRVRNQFSVAIAGTIVDGALVLDERFAYSDGKKDRRVWRIRRTGPNAYEGRAADVIGVARGAVQGNMLNWQYEMDLDIGYTVLRVHFDDWMFLQPTGMLINRARVSKFGIEIGSITLAFVKSAATAAPE